MSRYVVNKVMRAVNMEADAIDAYRTDAAGYVADVPDLTAAERNALAEKDYGALYALGAHPYLLWSFSEAVHVPPMTRPDLVESFRVAARAVGYPDCSTTPVPRAD